MGSPLAKHVPVVLTALLVRQVVRILLVLLEHMLPVQQRASHVPVVLTALLVRQVVRILQLLVLLEPMLLVQRVHYVPVVLIAMLGRPVVSLCTRNARVASVATVLVKVK